MIITLYINVTSNKTPELRRGWVKNRIEVKYNKFAGSLIWLF